jgi:hypothetical protein
MGTAPKTFIEMASRRKLPAQAAHSFDCLEIGRQSDLVTHADEGPAPGFDQPQVE